MDTIAITTDPVEAIQRLPLAPNLSPADLDYLHSLDPESQAAVESMLTPVSARP
jgi:hypothetical protein